METIENIKTDEGYRSEPYICSEGKLTWLYGRNIEDRPIMQEEWEELKLIIEGGGNIKEWADVLFTEELCQNERILEGWDIDLTSRESVIILNMLYNMGAGRFNQAKWPKFFKAIAYKDYKEAANQMIDSKWYGQVGHRATRLVNSMQNIQEG